MFRKCVCSPSEGKKYPQDMDVRMHVCVCARARMCVSCSVMSDSLRPHGAHQAPLSMEISRQG